MSSPRSGSSENRRSESSRQPGRARGSSLGIRHGPAEGTAARVVAFRALLPPGRFSESPSIDSRERHVRPHQCAGTARTRRVMNLMLVSPGRVSAWLPSSQVRPRRRRSPRIAFEDSAQVDPARLRRGRRDISLPVAVRVQAPAAADAGTEFGEKLDVAIAARACRCGSLLPAPASVQDAEAWRQRLAALLKSMATASPSSKSPSSREQAAFGVFAVKLAATEARSARSAIRIAIGGSLVDDAARACRRVYGRSRTVHRFARRVGCRRRIGPPAAGARRSQRDAGGCGKARRLGPTARAASSIRCSRISAPTYRFAPGRPPTR